MRNFVITVNGKSYQVGVEEVGATNAAPVAAPAPVTAPVATPAPVAAPAPAATPAPVAAPKAAPANGEKVLRWCSFFPSYQRRKR